MKTSEILTKVDNYYSEKVRLHGSTHKGVDWNSQASQELRFQQLLKLCNFSKPFSINDLGCGYAHLYQYLNHRDCDFHYHGIDISEVMIEHATKLYGHHKNFSVALSHQASAPADYSVASGVMNVKLDSSEASWKNYIKEILHTLDKMSLKGFSFNCLTSYSDPEKKRADLFYADPLELFDYCQTHFSRNIALLHDYNLYEFTILVKKIYEDNSK